MDTKWYQWYFKVIDKYIVFQGRASRSEFWYFYLMYAIIAISMSILDSILHTSVFILMYVLFFILPVSALLVRRLHDIGKNSWWTLIYWVNLLVLNILNLKKNTTNTQFDIKDLVILIAVIILIVFGAQDSQPGTNKYGENPKGVNNVNTENANNNTKNLNQSYKFCPKCGYKNDILANYCKQCGEKF